MKKKYILILITLFLFIIMLIVLSFVINNERLITVDSDDVKSISITKWQGQTVTIEEKNDINNFINYFESVKTNRSSLHLRKPNNWNYRVAIYDSNDSLSTLKEHFYIINDGEAYKNHIIYKLGDFDNAYFLKFLKR